MDSVPFTLQHTPSKVDISCSAFSCESHMETEANSGSEEHDRMEDEVDTLNQYGCNNVNYVEMQHHSDAADGGLIIAMISEDLASPSAHPTGDTTTNPTADAEAPPPFTNTATTSTALASLAEHTKLAQEGDIENEDNKEVSDDARSAHYHGAISFNVFDYTWPQNTFPNASNCENQETQHVEGTCGPLARQLSMLSEGGRPTKSTSSKSKGRHLTLDEKVQVGMLYEKSFNEEEIAEIFGCDQSTISNCIQADSVNMIQRRVQNGEVGDRKKARPNIPLDEALLDFIKRWHGILQTRLPRKIVFKCADAIASKMNIRNKKKEPWKSTSDWCERFLGAYGLHDMVDKKNDRINLTSEVIHKFILRHLRCLKYVS